MGSSHKSKAIVQEIERSSPLYDYWRSSQNNIEEQKRLQKSSQTFPAAALFQKEPYKWEMLYQSIILEIRKGDEDSIKGLKLLIFMLNNEEKAKTIEFFFNKKIFSGETIERLMQKGEDQSPTRKNPARFIRIMFAIFTNPYCIDIKRKKSHLYEQTGSALNQLRRRLNIGRFAPKNIQSL